MRKHKQITLDGVNGTQFGGGQVLWSLYIEAETKWLLLPNNIFKWIFLNENIFYLFFIKIMLKIVPKDLINNIPALV